MPTVIAVREEEKTADDEVEDFEWEDGIGGFGRG